MDCSVSTQNQPAPVIRSPSFSAEWIYHCHILEHEEGGMIDLFKIEG
ncbi:MAG TPA: hypothetical protein EYN66_03700 [Myxococcales bacterium]|nr:hypothetical protein [Myxococcales bacterium]